MSVWCLPWGLPGPVPTLSAEQPSSRRTDRLAGSGHPTSPSRGGPAFLCQLWFPSSPLVLRSVHCPLLAVPPTHTPNRWRPCGTLACFVFGISKPPDHQVLDYCHWVPGFVTYSWCSGCWAVPKPRSPAIPPDAFHSDPHLVVGVVLILRGVFLALRGCVPTAAEDLLSLSLLLCLVCDVYPRRNLYPRAHKSVSSPLQLETPRPRGRQPLPPEPQAALGPFLMASQQQIQPGDLHPPLLCTACAPRGVQRAGLVLGPGWGCLDHPHGLFRALSFPCIPGAL